MRRRSIGLPAERVKQMEGAVEGPLQGVLVTKELDHGVGAVTVPDPTEGDEVLGWRILRAGAVRLLFIE